MQTKNAKVAEQASLILPWFIRGCLFQPVWSVWEKTVHRYHAWTPEHLLIIQSFNSVDRARESCFDILHPFHINPLEYLSSTLAEIVKALADPRSYCEDGGGGSRKRRDAPWSHRDSPETFDLLLRVIQQRPASAHLCLPPNEASWLGWDCGGAPRWLAWLLVLVQWLPRHPSWHDEIIRSLF